MSTARQALVIAVDDYEDTALARLIAPQEDAERLAAALSDPDIGGFDVSVLHNCRAHEVSRQIEDFLSERGRADFLLLHFSGHGLKSDNGELYLAGTDTRPGRLRSTGVPADLVARLMNSSRAGRVALFLDCCYGGAFERGLVARAGAGVEVGETFRRLADHMDRGRVVITASSATEYAFEGIVLANEEVQPSVFTRALTQGLTTGEADLDQDGQITVDELYDYVYGEVRRSTPQQTPGKWVFGQHGEMGIANNAFRRVRPARLSEELLRQSREPFASTRLGVVEELKNLLATGTPDVRLAAYMEAQRLASDDSKRVSAAAEAVLAVARTAPDPRRISLDVDASAEIVLRGALAEALAVESIPDGVEVRKIRDRIRVRRTGSPSADVVEVVLQAGDIKVPLCVELPAAHVATAQVAASTERDTEEAAEPEPLDASSDVTQKHSTEKPWWAPNDRKPPAPKLTWLQDTRPEAPPARRSSRVKRSPSLLKAVELSHEVVDTNASTQRRRVLGVGWALLGLVLPLVIFLSPEPGYTAYPILLAAVLLVLASVALVALGTSAGLPITAGSLVAFSGLDSSAWWFVDHEESERGMSTALVTLLVIACAILVLDLGLGQRLEVAGPLVTVREPVRISAILLVICAAILPFIGERYYAAVPALIAQSLMLVLLGVLIGMRATQPIFKWPAVAAGLGTSIFATSVLSADFLLNLGDDAWIAVKVVLPGVLCAIAGLAVAAGVRTPAKALAKAGV